jgi:hypothetical protein
VYNHHSKVKGEISFIEIRDAIRFAISATDSRFMTKAPLSTNVRIQNEAIRPNAKISRIDNWRVRRYEIKRCEFGEGVASRNRRTQLPISSIPTKIKKKKRGMGCHVEAYGDLVESVTYGKKQGCRSESEICTNWQEREEQRNNPRFRSSQGLCSTGQSQRQSIESLSRQ